MYASKFIASEGRIIVDCRAPTSFRGPAWHPSKGSPRCTGHIMKPKQLEGRAAATFNYISNFDPPEHGQSYLTTRPLQSF